MLASLSIRDIVLIDRLELTFETGLCVLTGETGAGKSILLDALGLALGNRAEQRLIRPGAEKASVTASFDVPRRHPARALLETHEVATDEGEILLRRVLGADGRSRAFVNDQPVSVGLLRALGDQLIEIQGQFEDRGLLDPGSHRALLDAFGAQAEALERVAALWSAWRQAAEACAEAEASIARSKEDEAYLRHALAELEGLDPQPGEHESLAEMRSFLMHGEKLVEAVQAAERELSGGDRGGAEGALGSARRALERVVDKAGGRLEPVLVALDRAAAETEDALAALHSLSADLELEPGRLERIEERYFALNDLARKHGVGVERLAEVRQAVAERLESLDRGDERVAELRRAAEDAGEAYRTAAEALSEGRKTAAKALDRAVARELPPLKLDKARFHTQVERLEAPQWGPQGLDRVTFQVATNPGAEPGPLARVASGGELSRFLLALKVVLAGIGPRRTLVFDEVDSAVGGATAHAVGERLERLGRDRQVLVVTHSPQVAARGAYHWQVRKVRVKGGGAGQLATRVGQLTADERREELARMLSGAVVTDEARAAAERLMGAA